MTEALLIGLALAAAFWCGIRCESWCSRQIAEEEEREGPYWHKQFLNVQAKYMDLLWAVESKHPGEKRHATAKRYIMERERNNG